MESEVWRLSMQMIDAMPYGVHQLGRRHAVLAAVALREPGAGSERSSCHRVLSVTSTSFCSITACRLSNPWRATCPVLSKQPTHHRMLRERSYARTPPVTNQGLCRFAAREPRQLWLVRWHKLLQVLSMHVSALPWPRRPLPLL